MMSDPKRDPLDAALARLPREVQPSRDLWPAIEAELSKPVERVTQLRTRRVSSWRWMQMAAAVLIVVGTAVTTNVLTRRSMQEETSRVRIRRRSRRQCRWATPVTLMRAKQLLAAYSQKIAALPPECARKARAGPCRPAPRIGGNRYDSRAASCRSAAAGATGVDVSKRARSACRCWRGDEGDLRENRPMSLRRSVAIAIALLCAGTTGAAETVTRTAAADPRGDVEIVNVSGEVEVSGWDRNEVEVRADLGRGVERLDVTSDRRRVLVNVVLPKGRSNSGSTDLVVRVPRQSRLTIRTVSADQNVSNVQGAQSLQTVSGSITTEVWAEDLEVRSVSGEVLAARARRRCKRTGEHRQRKRRARRPWQRSRAHNGNRGHGRTGERAHTRARSRPRTANSSCALSLPAPPASKPRPSTAICACISVSRSMLSSTSRPSMERSKTVSARARGERTNSRQGTSCVSRKAPGAPECASKH